jgi:hypothetical protein
MAKEMHVAQATNFRGIDLAKRHLPFTNAIKGFEKLQRWITTEAPIEDPNCRYGANRTLLV